MSQLRRAGNDESGGGEMRMSNSYITCQGCRETIALGAEHVCGTFSTTGDYNADWIPSKPEPILHIYQDGDGYLAALPSFVDRQQSPVVWLDQASAKRIKFILEYVGSETDAALYFSGDEQPRGQK